MTTTSTNEIMKPDGEISVSKDNQPTTPTTSASSLLPTATTDALRNGAFGFSDFRNHADPENAVIDESCMPVELRKKRWKILKVLGEGGNFKVYLTANEDGLQFAMRVSRKQDRSTDVYEEDEESKRQTIRRNSDIKMLMGTHPNIVKMFGFRYVDSHLQQIMEYVSGGDLFDFVNDNYTRSILKLTDFDHAIHFTPGIKIACPSYATEAYAAPETFSRLYRPSCADMWACGIFLMFLLKNDVPWEVADKTRDNQYYKWLRMQMKGQSFRFRKSYEGVSEFVSRMLKVEEDERATVDEIVEHKWMESMRKK
uniref:Protein kinase domain-containing protein n=1 Tax=Setaria digitata TaxID=48799 RepID=A0A915PTL8_9BILA